MVDNLSELLSHRPNLERYDFYMNSSMSDKISAVIPYINEGDTVISVGAGTGKLEMAIVDIVSSVKMKALDASMPMLETIEGLNEENLDINNPSIHHVEPILAHAEDLPFGNETADVIIASSIVHEIASYVNDFTFGEKVEEFYENVAKVLKHGGRFILRDFVQPENPDEEIIMNVGKRLTENESDPAEFIEKFAEAFRGDDLTYVKDQIEKLKDKGSWGEGAQLKVNASHAFEIAAHYSWSHSFNEEVKEKYAYLPLDKYAEFITNAFEKVGEQAKVATQRSYLQDGYRDHISGRIDIQDIDGKNRSLPDFTGIIVIEKV